MKPSQQFPASKGWITAKLTVNKGANFTEEDARLFISLGKPHRCQFGLIETNCNPVKIIYRETRRAALDADTQPVATPLDLEELPVMPTPFIARCGKLIVQVNEVLERFQPLPMVRAEILAGKHFNDAGNYGPGDEVTIGPMSEHWEFLTFPDPVPA